MVCASGCATPQYAVRPAPQPEESASALELERAISAVQAKQFERQGARAVGWERRSGFAIQDLIDRLSRVTERPQLRYRAFLYTDKDPNAAALADGRIYISSGMLRYLANRGSRQDELAFVCGHELAHTVAQHLVKRYRYLQQQQLWMSVLAAGASALTRNADSGAQDMGHLAVDAAALLQHVADSGYIQDQEFEAYHLGIRYVMRAGFDPHAALALLQDFARFDISGPFLRTHPYVQERRAQLARYLTEARGPGAAPAAATDRAARVRELRRVQAQYPEGSVSWNNLERQIRAIE